MVEDVEELTTLGSKLINAILEGERIEKIRGLIESGAPLWYQDEAEGMSPLHAAAYAEGENAELIKMLIHEGAVWNAGWLYMILLVLN
jgi:protein arginine N-methyltransferase 2